MRRHATINCESGLEHEWAGRNECCTVGIMLAKFLSNVAISRGSTIAGLLPWDNLKAF
jgi:hypothetical protein